MAAVLLGLGSNQGDRVTNLRAAIRRLPPSVTVERVSALYETAPWGVTDQSVFLNAALLGETSLSPVELLYHVKQIEQYVGRRPGERWGPRILDIDILYYDDILLDTPDLQVPHPRIAERAFALCPLADLAPDLADPRSGKSVRDMLASVGDVGIERIAGPAWAEGGAPPE